MWFMVGVHPSQHPLTTCGLADEEAETDVVGTRRALDGKSKGTTRRDVGS
jgi:hypothetical protein